MKARPNHKRPPAASKEALRNEISELRSVGNQMSNVCFNLSQNPPKTVDAHDAKGMEDLWRKWDAIVRRERPVQP